MKKRPVRKNPDQIKILTDSFGKPYNAGMKPMVTLEFEKKKAKKHAKAAAWNKKKKLWWQARFGTPEQKKALPWTGVDGKVRDYASKFKVRPVPEDPQGSS